ncbi:MAG: ATP-dependent Clp protease ATP-binding subunit ClpX [Candidatus Shikimatogenerans sp. Ttur]|uniref:ATP-dependent Clp protease ATP-binding subunit ClpX n=1 Tax=Candidatus Shikimatogenerans sp. Ttur TaxID=3158569 RepID=A0AAU7ZY39_9FLAO
MCNNINGDNNNFSFIKCSYCGRDKKQVYLLINQFEVYICNVCIEKFYKLMSNKVIVKENIKFILNKINEMNPIYIKSYLDKYIIGQYEAKKTLSVSIYIHYKRIINNLLLNSNINIEKSNIILIGPTGTGKTYMLKTISKLLNVPFVIVNSTSFTESGYVGEDVENILFKLFQKANYSVELTEIGIVFIDEIDKICKKNGRSFNTKDISGEGVQQALLKMLEGSIIDIPVLNSKNFIRRDTISINTENILFIVGGAFVYLSNTIFNRLNKAKIGYTVEENKFDKDDMYKYITHFDLINYGFIPEFIGRLPVIANTNKLEVIHFKKIILEVKDSILLQYKKLFEIEKKKIFITNRGIDLIIKKSIILGIGARGLKNIFNKIFRNIFYNIVFLKQIIVINKKFIKKVLFTYE